MAKNEYAHFRISASLKSDIEASSAKNNETLTETFNRLLSKAIQYEKAGSSMDDILPLIRQAVKDSIKPSVERLAKINAKTNIQAGIALHLMMEALEKSNKDITHSYEVARKKAVAELRVKNVDIEFDISDNEYLEGDK